MFRTTFVETQLPPDVFSVIGRYLSNDDFSRALQASNTIDGRPNEMLGLIQSIPIAGDYKNGTRINISTGKDMVQFRERRVELKKIVGLWIFLNPAVVPEPWEFADFDIVRFSCIGFTTHNVVIWGESIVDGTNMFCGCERLIKIDFMTLNTITNGERMFHSCHSLTTLPAGMTLEGLGTGPAMFKDCCSMETLPPNMNLNNLTNGEEMFDGCCALKTLPTGMILHNLANGVRMFCECDALASLPDKMTLYTITNGDGMFDGCSALTILPTGITPWLFGSKIRLTLAVAQYYNSA